MPNILLIEDNADIALSIQYNLNLQDGYRVEVRADGESGFQAAQDISPDLILLDLNLPGMDGVEVCRQLRANPQTKDVMIIMLTARVDESDRIQGLDTGADDYVTKPFSMKELQARIRALLRRSKATPASATSPSHQLEPPVEPSAAPVPQLSHGALRLDPEARTVQVGDSPITLTRMEFDLLADLIRHRDKVRTRGALLQAVWGYDDIGSTRTVDVHVRQLRRKLGDALSVDLETVIGVGYKLNSKT